MENYDDANEHDNDDLFGDSGLDDLDLFIGELDKKSDSSEPQKPKNNEAAKNVPPSGAEESGRDLITTHSELGFSGPFPSLEKLASPVVDGMQSRETRNILEFGPLENLAEKLSKTLPLLDQHNPSMHVYANNYLSNLREALHDSVLVTPAIHEQGAIGMAARQEAVSRFEQRAKAIHATMTNYLPEEYQGDFKRYAETVGSLVGAERSKITIAEQSLQPMNTVEALLAKTSKKLFGGADPELISLLRAARERDVTSRLNRLNDIASEMSKNVGSLDWERGEGLRRSKEAKGHVRHVNDLMGKCVLSTDEKGFIPRFNAIKKSFSETANNAVDDEFKGSIKSIMESMQQFISAILAKLGIRNTVTSSARVGPTM